jgi:hypothetical protein
MKVCYNSFIKVQLDSFEPKVSYLMTSQLELVDRHGAVK